MKKYLSLLTISTLSNSTLLIVGMVLNSNVVKNLNLKNNLKSLNDNLFISQMAGTSGKVISLAVDNQSNIYTGSEDGNIYKIDLLNNLLKVNLYDCCGPKYNGFVYNKQQTIDLKEKYLKSATLDGIPISVPSTQHIIAGKHTLVLTVKDDVKQYLDLFGGNPTTGTITYNFWFKTAIDSNTEFNY